MRLVQFIESTQRGLFLLILLCYIFVLTTNYLTHQIMRVKNILEAYGGSYHLKAWIYLNSRGLTPHKWSSF